MVSENKYDIDTKVEGVEEKKRYTQLEKAQRVIALNGRIESAKAVLKEDLNVACADIIAIAKLSNSKDVVKFAEQIETKLIKILG